MAQVKTCDLVETEQKAPEGETGGAQEGVSVPTAEESRPSCSHLEGH